MENKKDKSFKQKKLQKRFEPVENEAKKLKFKFKELEESIKKMQSSSTDADKASSDVKENAKDTSDTETVAESLAKVYIGSREYNNAVDQVKAISSEMTDVLLDLEDKSVEIIEDFFGEKKHSRSRDEINKLINFSQCQRSFLSLLIVVVSNPQKNYLGSLKALHKKTTASYKRLLRSIKRVKEGDTAGGKCKVITKEMADVLMQGCSSVYLVLIKLNQNLSQTSENSSNGHQLALKDISVHLRKIVEIQNGLPENVSDAEILKKAKMARKEFILIGENIFSACSKNERKTFKWGLSPSIDAALAYQAWLSKFSLLVDTLAKLYMKYKNLAKISKDSAKVKKIFVHVKRMFKKLLRAFKHLNKNARLFPLKEVIIIRLSKSVEVFILALENGQPAENAADDAKKLQENFLKAAEEKKRQEDLLKRVDAATDTSVDKPPDPEQEKKLNKWWLDYDLNRPIFKIAVPIWKPPANNSEFEMAKSIFDYLENLCEIVQAQVVQSNIADAPYGSMTIITGVGNLFTQELLVSLKKIFEFLKNPIKGVPLVFSTAERGCQACTNEIQFYITASGMTESGDGQENQVRSSQHLFIRTIITLQNDFEKTIKDLNKAKSTRQIRRSTIKFLDMVEGHVKNFESSGKTPVINGVVCALKNLIIKPIKTVLNGLDNPYLYFYTELVPILTNLIKKLKDPSLLDFRYHRRPGYKEALKKEGHSEQDISDAYKLFSDIGNIFAANFIVPLQSIVPFITGKIKKFKK